MIELVIAIIEAIIGIFTAIIEFIASLFSAGGEALGAGEAVIVLFLLLIEIVFWFFLWVVELTVSLLKWRKPRKIKKPVLWRPKKKHEHQEAKQNAE